MSLQTFTDNASTTLSNPISSTSNTITLFAGGGALFPSIGTGPGFFIATLIAAANASTREIIQVTARSSDTLTVVRGQEGTTALSWAAGDTIALQLTAGSQGTWGSNNFSQPLDVQAQAGNFASDTGGANAYSVVLTPPLTAHQNGMPIRFQAAHSNTGNCTFNDGVGVLPLLTKAGLNIPVGYILQNFIYTAIYNVIGDCFTLNDPSAVALPTIDQNPTNLTIAQRTSTGQLFATYFNGNSGLENPSVGAVVVQNSAADGFFRKISLANFMTQAGAATVTGGWNVGPLQVRIGSLNVPGVIVNNVTFGTRFTNSCSVILISVRGNPGVEFFCHSPTGGTPSAPSATAFSIYANANAQMDYIAIGN